MIPLFKVFMSDTAKYEVGKVLDSGYIGQGPKVEEFENLIKQRFNNDRFTTVNSGTSGLHLSIHLLRKPIEDLQWFGYENGDEVLTTPLTCTATNFPILANNLNIKWVDINPKTLNMDLDDLENKLSPKTKIIMTVHWGGYPNDLDRLKSIQQKCYDLYGFRPMIIEDAAHSFGSKFNGEYLGNHGNIVVYSFQAIKHLTTGDGGGIFFPHHELYRRSKLLRWYGIDREDNRKDFRCEEDIEEWGFKFHMNDISATIGIENLKHIDGLIQQYVSNSEYYDNHLKDVSGIELLERKENHESSYWIYSMLVDDREGFYKHMKECGIMVSQVHERNDKHSTVKEYSEKLPFLDSYIGKVVSIPNGWWVTEKDREYIVDSIKKGW